MYIRKVKKSNKIVSVRIVEGARDAQGKVKQKIIKIVGQASKEGDIVALERAANEMMLALTCTTGINNRESDPSSISDEIKLNSVQEIKRVNDGIIDVFGSFFDECLFGSIIEETYKDEQWNSIIKSLVLARISNPTSKRKTSLILSKDYLTEIPLEKIYRSMDRLFLFKNKVKEVVLEQTKKFNEEKISVMLFDVTTLYFESFTSDELKKNGFSKDCKFKEMQIVLSLTTTKNGLPIDIEIFPGNTSEGNTLISSLTRISEKFDVNDVTLIADRAMFSDKNLTDLENKGFKYIVACKLKSLSKKMKDSILNSEDYRARIVEEELYWLKEYSVEKNRRLIASYSSKRARKDKNHREKLIERIINKVKNGEINVSEIIGNSGTKKFIDCKNKKVTINQGRVNQDALWDGIHGVITNLGIITSAESILGRYRQLWRIEEAFRINKYDLKMRPIFHWKPRRIEAHILICYLAFSLSKYMLVRLEKCGIKISLEELKEELSRIESSVLQNTSKQTEFYICPSKLTEKQAEIYKALGIIRRETPWLLK